MVKKRVILERFKCDDADGECPTIGFQVVQAIGVDLERDSYLLPSDVLKLRRKGVKIEIQDY